MKKKHLITAFFITAGLYSLNIVFEIFITRSLSGTFLISLLAGTAYLAYQEEIAEKELGLITGTFVISGLLYSLAVKNVVWDICETAKALNGSAVSAALSQEEVCPTVLELWKGLLLDNPLNTPEFWIVTLSVPVISFLAYRKFKERQIQENV